jgi:hypothetical protein
LIRWFGAAVADIIVWWIINKLIVPRLGSSFCSVFPLREIIECPDFDGEIKKASDEYLAKYPVTVEIPGWDRWKNK